MFSIADYFLKLVEQHRPLELVTKLFEDDSIVERNRVAAGNYPDIASAVEEISRYVDHKLMVSTINGLKWTIN